MQNRGISHDNLPIKLLRPLCKWKKRKGDSKMPSKQDALYCRWMETKDRKDLCLEDYIKGNSSIFQMYEQSNKGEKLTMHMIDKMVKKADNIDVVRNIVEDDIYWKQGIWTALEVYPWIQAF